MVAVRSTSKGSSFGSSVSAAQPNGLKSGDVMFACQTSTSPFTSVPAPAGWAPTVALDDDTFGDLYTRVWRRTPGSSEAASYVFPQPPGAPGTVLIAAVQDADLTVQVRIAILETYEASTAAATPGVTPAAASHLEVRFAVNAVQFTGVTVSLAAPSGYTPAPGGQVAIAGEITAAVASRQISSSANSGVKNFAITGANVGVNHGITISIAAGTVEPEIPEIPADAPGQGDALYSYRFSRLFGGPLGDLDLHGVSFEKRLNRRGQINPGNFSATYPIPNEDQGDLVAALIPRDPADLTRGPGVIVCDIWRAGEHWGRYWIIGAKITKQRRSRPVLQLSGVTMDAYLLYIQLEEQLGPFEGEDRVEIARQLITHMQNQPDADIGLIMQAGTCGHTLTRTFEAHQGNYGQHLASTTEGLDGYDWTVNTKLGVSGVELHLVWGDPLGDQSAPHEFSESPHGGNILDWGIEQAPLSRGTRWRARGDSVSTDASTASTPLLSAAYESPHLATGYWPRIDRTVDRPGVTDVATLNAVAEQLAATAGGAPQVLSVTVLLGQEPSFTPNNVGDGARITLTNEVFKRVNGGAGLDERRRILGMRVTPVGRENGRDEAELFIDDQAVE
ncbi:hypothetical protein AB0J63_17615 [Streptosporangium canum]|uniref:hypothetical protein n=1 Tax=Streptosporangium canum TaxID=324952 RepID=UPI003442F417